MSKGTIEIFTPQGEAKQYKLFSARLPEFLKAYPKEKGYRVKVEAVDPLTKKPGLMQLYQAAISAGKTPQDVGLPPVVAGDLFIFQASLLDKEGNVLECASALRVIQAYKDWEIGETAARQRLIAALGFGGECFDEDEKSDMADQGLASTNEPEPPAVPEEKQEQDQPQAPEPASQQQEAPDTAPDPAASESEAKPAPAPEPAPKKAKPSKAEGESEEIPSRIIRQIEHQAKLKGKEVPEVKTVKEAKQALKQLLSPDTAT